MTKSQAVLANTHMLETHRTLGVLERSMGHTPIPLHLVLASLTEAVCRPSNLRPREEQEAFCYDLAYGQTLSQARVALNQHRVELEFATWGTFTTRCVDCDSTYHHTGSMQCSARDWSDD